jgi:uncharacterized protein
MQTSRFGLAATCTAALLCAGCAAPPAPRGPAVQAEAGSPASILVFTRTTGWRHDSIPAAVAALREIAGREGLSVVHTEDPAVFSGRGLAGHAAVVFANTTGDVLGSAQQAALEAFVRDGGGFVGVHSAADTGYGWAWYGDLVGAWFDSHPPGLQQTVVRFEGGHGSSPADPWRVTDELYNYRRNPRPHAEVVATVDERTYAGGTMGDDHPIAWCHARFGGRAWYTGLGHDSALYADATFRAHLLQGLRYATGRADTC